MKDTGQLRAYQTAVILDAVDEHFAMKQKQRRSFRLDTIFTKLVEVDSKIRALPPLSAVDKVKLEHDRDIEHLYYSSRLEGTILTDERLNKAIHGPAL